MSAPDPSTAPAVKTTTTATGSPLVSAFHVHVPQPDLDDLQARVRAARLPGVLGDGSDETGFTTTQARDLLEHWRTRFDWRSCEAQINALEHLLVDVGASTGQTVQRVHVARAQVTRPTASRPPGDISQQPLPVVLVHGWPDSFLRYRHLVEPLTAAGHDVYLPSLPGFAFSDQPTGPATVEGAAQALLTALEALGVARFAVHGGDWGSAVAEQMAITAPDRVVALHLSDVPWPHFFSLDRAGASDAEQVFFEAGDAWAAQAAYVSVQATQTTTLALALADSPLGMAAWWAEKYHAWSDGPVGWEEVLVQVCLTWFTRTEHSGMRYYAAMGSSVDWDEDSGDDDAALDPAESQAGRDWVGDAGSGEGSATPGWGARAQQPVAVAVFPADIHLPPREFAARAFPGLRRFTVMPRGGHFAALEHPDLLAADITGFLNGLG